MPARPGRCSWPGAIPPTAIAAVVLAVFQVSELLSPRLLDLGKSCVLAIGLASLARGASDAVLAPGRKARRLLDFDASRAASIHQLVVWSSRIFAAAIVLNALHKAVVAPLSLTLATSAVMTLAIMALTAWTLWATKPEMPSEDEAEDEAPREPEEDVNSRAQRWLRLFGWIVILVCAVALAVGYVGFAAFFIGRLVIAAVLIGVVYLAVAMIDATVSEGLMATTVRGRRTAAMLGVAPSTLEVIATVLSGLGKVMLFGFATVVAVGPWGVHVVDITSTFSEVFFGVELNSFVEPLTAVASAITLLVGVLILTRLLQGWLERNLLPRTRIEPSLQHSVKQIVGYVGIIVAVILALGQIGIDLQNIALVAGALSVGIGFGLQSIVSNFVSGLILLTERPIRVGDTIAVKGEEGYVRRISVRATEIETFERVERDRAQHRPDHRRRQELDARQPDRAHHRRRQHSLRRRPRRRARHPDRGGVRASAGAEDADAAGVPAQVRRHRAAVRAALHRHQCRLFANGPQRSSLLDSVSSAQGRHRHAGGAAAARARAACGDDRIPGRQAMSLHAHLTRRLVLTGGIAALAAACGTADVELAAPAGANASLTRPGVRLDRQQGIDLVNSFRAANGLGALAIDSQLNALAEEQARTMAAAGKMSHEVGGDLVLAAAPRRLPLHHRRREHCRRPGHLARRVRRLAGLARPPLGDAGPRRHPDGHRRGAGAGLGLQDLSGR